MSKLPKSHALLKQKPVISNPLEKHCVNQYKKYQKSDWILYLQRSVTLCEYYSSDSVFNYDGVFNLPSLESLPYKWYTAATVLCGHLDRNEVDPEFVSLFAKQMLENLKIISKIDQAKSKVRFDKSEMRYVEAYLKSVSTDDLADGKTKGKFMLDDIASFTATIPYPPESPEGKADKKSASGNLRNQEQYGVELSGNIDDTQG
jgi:hypothetical protein